MNNIKIILASSSPRRIILLQKLGLKFKIFPPTYTTEVVSEDPLESAELNALEKARSVARFFLEGLVIGADTVVEINGKILGKPKSLDEAKNFLRELSGKMHRVITGLAIIDSKNNKEIVQTAITKVFFKELTEKEIDLLVKLEQPLDKAGGYAIQGVASLVVTRIEGDFWNVVGFPISLLQDMLIKYFNVNLLEHIKPSISLI